MAYHVQLTDDAASDLEAIYEYISLHDSPSSAEYVLDRIESVFHGLSEHPQRGSYPRELLKIGVRDFREVFFKPYRIIYRVAEDIVYVLVIADGRRDMQTLLQRRLLQG
ncbi:MAG: type II toxin-antitoxin system RelE/ParE family toxin [Gemmatimonadota bacterium]|nr:type II toxin-antitoxin system RelE/ParE family toxin [Gemmatimonadota bacterium]